MSELRKARKLCQMSLQNVSSLTNFTVQELSDIERGELKIAKATAVSLWVLYVERELPPRFEGNHQSVRELWAKWNKKTS